jgi:hypothetical protein
MVDVRIRVGLAGLTGEAVADCLAVGVIGGAGLLDALLTVVKDGLQAGVCGDGAVIDAWDAVDVE